MQDLGAFLGAAGIHIDAPLLQAIVQLLVSLAGLIAVLVPEKRLSN